MSSRFEELVVFALITLLVALFAWIYLRDRQKSTGLWMLGWIAIFVHFAALAFDDFLPPLQPFTNWIMTSTLIIAGTCFLLSVSEVFLPQERRIAFGLFISGAATLYLTAMVRHVHAPWFYIALLLISNVYATVQAIRFYSWKSLHLYCVL